ncbi:glycosyltransferase [Pelagicoccus albus]|uniref:Glycosyltransferase n=1 Tax=Pelagicoccus albus TaxID=415222 RepID=A0A7X1E8K8_9BACT|nr:glycosyltransferase [Pelagicoccus albus]MBC2606890.1 glycosyltransferase [Pelagicoccus albus]
MDCFLVVPCLRESGRVEGFLRELCEEVNASELSIGLLLVDDGSGLSEVEALRRIVARLRNDYPFLEEVYAMQKHLGKGAAIRSGWRLAPSDSVLLGFVDADGSVSASETVRVLRDALEEKDLCLVMASRRAVGAKVERSGIRKCVAAGFAAMVKLVYGVGVLDTQCGCKFVDNAWFQAYSLELRELGFGFDLELILKARETGCPMREVGVVWTEVEGSKVGLSTLWNLGKRVLLRRIGQTSEK